VYFEIGDDINQAIYREKQIKQAHGKIRWICKSHEPEWKDLYKEMVQ